MIRHRIQVMLLWAIVGWVSLSARTVTLEACLDSALASNPAVNAAALQVEKARTMRHTAFNPPFTSVVLKQNATEGGGPENGVAISQDFEFPGVYVTRHRMLGARVRLEEARFDIIAAEMERDVKAAYFNLLYQGEILRLTERLQSIYARFCYVAAVRLEQGDCSRLELLNAQRVSEKCRMEREMLGVGYRNSMAELSRLTGISGDIEPVDTALYILQYDVPSGFDFMATRQGVAAEQEVGVARREVTLAKNELLPGISLGATIQALIPGFNPYNIDRQRFRQGNFMGFEVGITVPLFFGAPAARVRAAHAEEQITQLRLEAAEAEAQSEVTKLNETLQTLGLRIEYFRNVSLPQAREIERLAEVSYELGDIDYMEYISNLETAFGIYRDYADTVNDYNQTVIKINSIL